MEKIKASLTPQRAADGARRLLDHDLRRPDELDLLADAVLEGAHPRAEAGSAQDHEAFVAALRPLLTPECQCGARNRPARNCGIAS